MAGIIMSELVDVRHTRRGWPGARGTARSMLAVFEASASTPLGLKIDAARSVTSLLRAKPRSAGTPTSSTRCAAARAGSVASSQAITARGRFGPPGRAGGRPPVVSAKSRRARSTIRSSSSP